MNNDPTGNEGSAINGNSIIDDDDPLEELRRIRQQLYEERKRNFGDDWERYRASLDVESWAAGRKLLHYGETEPREPELPADLTGLIPDREDFIQGVRLLRGVSAKGEPDLDAYNEDGRRRARALGFPEESFVVGPSDFPRDWQDIVREREEEYAAQVAQEAASGANARPEETRVTQDSPE